VDDAVSHLLLDLAVDPFVFIVALALAIAGAALTFLALDGFSKRGGVWARGALIVGGAMLVASALHARKREPGVIIVCESGGVYRPLNESAGFIASGGPCVLHDQHGGHASAEAISVYDNALSAP
jgi:hypothetical protein